MNDFDYGKAAYYRLEELTKRLAALENPPKAPVYTEEDMSFGIYLNGEADKRVDFIADGDQNAVLHISLSSDIPVAVRLNGVPLQLSDGNFESEVELNDGNNALDFHFSYGSPRRAEVSLCVKGFIVDRPIQRLLAYIGGNFYSYLDGDTCYIVPIGATNPVISLYGVDHAQAFHSDAGIFVAVIRGGVLSVLRYTDSGVKVFEAVADGVYKKCAVRVRNGRVLLYGVRGSYLWTGFVRDSGTITDSRTGIRAADVSFREVNGDGWLLVTDPKGVISLCRLSPLDSTTVIARYTVGRISGARIAKRSSVCVWHIKGGAVCERSFDGLKFSGDSVVTSADEAIIADDGTVIVREGETIRIL